MQELIHNDVLHAHRLERGDRQPAGEDFAGDALAHQGHGDAKADQPVGNHAAKEGQEETETAESFVFLLDVGHVQFDDGGCHFLPNTSIGGRFHGAAARQAEVHDHSNHGCADPVAEPDPTPVPEGGAPRALASPCRHGEQGEITGDQFHAEQDDAGKAEREENRSKEWQTALLGHRQGQDHSQSKNRSGVEAAKQQIFNTDSRLFATGSNHAVDKLIRKDVVHLRGSCTHGVNAKG